MIKRQTPIDIENYELVTDTSVALQLHEFGVYPKYIDMNGTYFLKSEYNSVVNKIK